MAEAFIIERTAEVIGIDFGSGFDEEIMSDGHVDLEQGEIFNGWSFDELQALPLGSFIYTPEDDDGN